MKSALTGWSVASIPAPDTPGQTYQGWSPCIAWCKEHFGDKADSGWYFRGEGIFEFRDDTDYMMFTLMWGK